MTKEEAKIQYPGWNPRYIAFCLSRGETPQQREEKSEIDGRSYMHEFLLWMNTLMSAFQEKKIKEGYPQEERNLIVLLFEAEFDDYLFSQAP